MSIKRLSISVGVLAALILSFQIFTTARPAAAQASTVPDMSQFGYPQVGATAVFTPGEAITVTAGTQQVVLPSDFISKTVKFELLLGDPSSFKPFLPADDASRPIDDAFAFRVTDVATNQLVGRFDKPVQWSITDPSITTGSAVYNTSPANPPVVTDNPSPGTVTGNTLSHPFGGAGVGWLVLGPEAAETPTAVPAAPATPEIQPTPEMQATPVVPIGMPATGNPSSDGTGIIAIAVLVGLLCLAGGVALRRRRVV